MPEGNDWNRDDACTVLLERMEKLVDALAPYQRDYHAVLQVDIYWYIEKHKELEMLMTRLLQCDNAILKDYLESLCQDIKLRIDADERFARDYTSRRTKADLVNTSYGQKQKKEPYQRTH